MTKGKKSKQSGSVGSSKSVRLPGRSEIVEGMVKRLGEVLWRLDVLTGDSNLGYL